MKTFTWSIFSPENEKLLREVKNLASLSDDDVCRIKNGVRDLNVALVHAEKNQEDIVPLVVGKKQPWASWPNAFAILGNLERTYAYTNVEVSKLLLTSTPLPLTGDITRRHASHKRSTVHPELISLFKDYVSSQNHSGNPIVLGVFSNM